MIFDTIREGGPGAYLAIALGALGVLLGGLSMLLLLGKNRSSFALGIVTLIVAVAAAGAGILGTVYGRSQVNSALAYVDSEVDKERILRAGFREAQSASWIGLFAALLPLAFGAAAAVGGARLQAPKTREQRFGEPVTSADDGLAGQTVVAFIFTAIGVIAAGGAWAMAHTELPKLRYPFHEADTVAWSLASALEDVSKNREHGCRNLGEALDSFWGASDKREWPRVMRMDIPPELAGWRPAADACAKKLLLALDDGRKGDGELDLGVSQEELLQSPLLQDEALHAQVLAWKKGGAALEGGEPPTQPDALGAGVLGALGKAPPGSKLVGSGSLEPSQIRAVIQRNLSAIRYCYERELVSDPKLEGKLVVHFTVGQAGSVVTADEASDAPFPSAKVTGCVLSRFKAMVFPKPLGGGTVSVKYPLIFKAAD